MAVYTDINETELEDFLKGYNVGGLLSYKGIAEGAASPRAISAARSARLCPMCWPRAVAPAST